MKNVQQEFKGLLKAGDQLDLLLHIQFDKDVDVDSDVLLKVIYRAIMAHYSMRGMLDGKMDFTH